MSKKYFDEATSSDKLELVCDIDALNDCLDLLEEEFLITKPGKWFVPRVAGSAEKAVKKMRLMRAGRTGYAVYPEVFPSKVVLLDDEKAFVYKRDVEFTGVKNIPPYLYFLIERIIKGDVSAYFELQDYGNHIDMVPYSERLKMLEEKANNFRGYDNLDKKITYLQKMKKVYEEFGYNQGFNCNRLRYLWKKVCESVKINNLEYDIGKTYAKRRETK